MCGISTFFARESIPHTTCLDTLLSWGEKRGQDGFGFIIARKDKLISYYTTNKYSDEKSDILLKIKENMDLGDVLIAISRAAPETEPESSEENLQPIKNNNCILAHNGAISNSVYNDLRKQYQNVFKSDVTTNIDSEAILLSYLLHSKDIKSAMEYISGGVASVMMDIDQDRLYIMSDFKPVAHAYIRGYGYFVSSDNECLREIVENINGSSRCGMCLWEDYYYHWLSGQSIYSIDLTSGFQRKIKYSPRFITQQWDSNFSNNIDEDLCLVAASGGLDSSTTLAILQKAGYKNIVACHFKYGHRGQDAEEMAIRNITDILGIPLKIFDIEQNMRDIDKTSMLIDENAEITTGTSKGLKQLDAWVNGRNMLFLTYMATFAEAQVMDYGFKNVYFLGGMMQLTESGHFCDNSEYFIQTMLEMFKYGTLIGNRIKPMYGLSNLMKSDQFTLIDAFNLYDIYKYSISCDRPIVQDGVSKNCSKNGVPACGSGLLSYWGSKLAGMNDMDLRNFYEVEEDYKAYVPQHMEKSKPLQKDIKQIISRILIPEDRKQVLLKELENNSKL